MEAFHSQLTITKVTDPGSAVKKGDIVLELDSSELKLLKAQAEVEPLKLLVNLKVLNLYHTLVTERGFETLKASLPNCRIIWDRESSLPNRRGS
jgi:hypothetical protein